jgi:hypothetical protein
MRTKPPPKKTIPNLRKATDKAGKEMIAPEMKSGAATCPSSEHSAQIVA